VYNVSVLVSQEMQYNFMDLDHHV